MLHKAMDGIINLISNRFNLRRVEAIALGSTVVVDLRVTQVVNEVKGVHAVLRHDAFI
ncbi:hypothetical protein [Clostridium guangxiense]|uniref:hypothetical protein n=1 Tax=Clostridium guangxiense TaxID=1662055 RepID=UPI001E33D0A5|nr:hypothetical protein [Clostridium guangxiense]MCD2347960.1 hypothetical protein [Clostridium guangxiense]